MKLDLFQDLIEQAPAGMQIMYYAGNLAVDRNSKDKDKAFMARQIGRAAWDAMERGKIELTQVRVGPEMFEYVATKRALRRRKIWTGCYRSIWDLVA